MGSGGVRTLGGKANEALGRLGLVGLGLGAGGYNLVETPGDLGRGGTGHLQGPAGGLRLRGRRA